MAPAATPVDVVVRLQEACRAGLKSAATAERFASEDAVTGGGPPAEFAALIAREQRKWKEVVTRANIRAD